MKERTNEKPKKIKRRQKKTHKLYVCVWIPYPNPKCVLCPTRVSIPFRFIHSQHYCTKCKHHSTFSLFCSYFIFPIEMLYPWIHVTTRLFRLAFVHMYNVYTQYTLYKLYTIHYTLSAVKSADYIQKYREHIEFCAASTKSFILVMRHVHMNAKQNVL